MTAVGRIPAQVAVGTLYIFKRQSIRMRLRSKCSSSKHKKGEIFETYFSVADLSRLQLIVIVECQGHVAVGRRNEVGHQSGGGVVGIVVVVMVVHVMWIGPVSDWASANFHHSN